MAKVGGVQTSPDISESAFLGAVSDSSGGDDPWAIELTLQGRPLTLHIDTGAEVTVITEQAWKGVGQPHLELPDRTLRGPDSHLISTLGKFTGTFLQGTRRAESEVYRTRQVTARVTNYPRPPAH